MRVCKAYESNAGTMAIFAIEGDAAVWSHFYFGDAYEMGLVWIELAVNDRDPVAENIIRWVPPVTALICAGIALYGFVYYQFFL